MFPTSNEAPFEYPSIFFEEDKFLEDLLADCPISEGKMVFSGGEVRGNDECSGDSKKTAHKFTERQRRQEMTSLYKSLRSLLPLEYVKGKRAVSDHMDQAVNYINDMKKRIEEMKVRKDKKRGRNVSDRNAVNGGESSNRVKINVSRDGMEILINSSLDVGSSFPLSRVLAVLLTRQLNVVDYVCARGDKCYLHKIQIEVSDFTSMDQSELQEVLEKLTKFA